MGKRYKEWMIQWFGESIFNSFPLGHVHMSIPGSADPEPEASCSFHCGLILCIFKLNMLG